MATRQPTQGSPRGCVQIPKGIEAPADIGPAIRRVQQVKPFDQHQPGLGFDDAGIFNGIPNPMFELRPGNIVPPNRLTDSVEASGEGGGIEGPWGTAPSHGGFRIRQCPELCFGEVKTVHAQGDHRLWPGESIDLRGKTRGGRAFPRSGLARQSDQGAWGVGRQLGKQACDCFFR